MWWTLYLVVLHVLALPTVAAILFFIGLLPDVWRERKRAR